MRLAVSGLRRNRNPRRFGHWLEVCPAIPVLVIGGKSGRAVFGTTLAAAAVGFAWTSTRQFGEGLTAHRAPRCHEFVSYSSRIRGKNLPRWWDLRAIACRGCLTVVTRGRRWSESVAVFIGPWRWLGARRPPCKVACPQRDPVDRRASAVRVSDSDRTAMSRWRLAVCIDRISATPPRTTGVGRPTMRSYRGSEPLKRLPALARPEGTISHQ